jgi:general secretion pathway protein A
MAVRLLHRLSGGVPRLINTLCERSLLAIFSRGRQRVGVTLVWQAAREVKGRTRRSVVWSWSLLTLLLAAIGAAIYLQWPSADPQTGESGAQAAFEADLSLVAPESPPPSLIVPEMLAPPFGMAVDEPVPPPTPEPMTGAQTELAASTLRESPAAAQTDAQAQTAAEPAEYFDPARLFQQPAQYKRMYQLLFALWGVSDPPQSPLVSCVQVPVNGLRCFRGQGEWGRIEALNRPLLLRLVKDKEVRLLLLKLKQDELLVVDDGNGESLMLVSQLKPYWQGEYVMMWRPPAGVSLIGDGSRGQAVTWLRRRLQHFDQQPLPTLATPDLFDEPLKQRLQAFQRANGLLDDGMAGQQTLIYLNNLQLAPGTPCLQTDKSIREG